ncbi:MAG: rolling circle replication-associated protein, partial [bacterium]
CDNARYLIKTQFCMTYSESWPENGRLLKDHLHKFHKRLRKRFPGIKYLWVCEFQSRGAPHFHWYSDLEHTPENHNILANAWHEIAGSDDGNHLLVHAFGKNFIPWDMYSSGYLCKYLDKEHQKTIPDGFASFGRFWGNSHNLTPKVVDEISKDEVELFSHPTQERPWEYMVRTVCRYQESKHRRTTIRTTPQSRYVYSGAKIATTIRDHLLRPPKGWDQKGEPAR